MKSSADLPRDLHYSCMAFFVQTYIMMMEKGDSQRFLDEELDNYFASST